jgi:two-component system, OmpR family, phosphate regulon sensor histidine kinase PhoR
MLMPTMEAAATSASDGEKAKHRLTSPKDAYTSQIRLLVVLILCFAVVPGALILTVGILVLTFGDTAHDIVFGVLIVSLAATFVAGIVLTFIYARRATSLARLQGEFVQKVSHDLRTPLTSIRMFVETMGRTSDAAQIRECVDVLGAETQRLSAMVERLLGWAKMEAGKRVYHATRVPAADVVRTALRTIEPQIKAAELAGAKVHVTVELADHLPELHVDADAVSEALVDVLQNALRYTGRAKELRVRAVRKERDVEITIADNGPGIPRNEQRRIFEKFYRVIDPANPNVEGTGLGLAMVHHIVRAHHGRISVDSDVGRGAAFHIALPALNEAG